MMPALNDPKHEALLEWTLCPPHQRQPATLKELADHLGVTDRSLRNWKERDDFQAEWRRRFNEAAGSMDRLKTILDVLYADIEDEELGKNDRRQAAKLYFDIAKQVAPPEPDEKPSAHASELSDEELKELLSQAALKELEERGVA